MGINASNIILILGSSTSIVISGGTNSPVIIEVPFEGSLDRFWIGERQYEIGKIAILEDIVEINTISAIKQNPNSSNRKYDEIQAILKEIGEHLLELLSPNISPNKSQIQIVNIWNKFI